MHLASSPRCSQNLAEGGTCPEPRGAIPVLTVISLNAAFENILDRNVHQNSVSLLISQPLLTSQLLGGDEVESMDQYPQLAKPKGLPSALTRRSIKAFCSLEDNEAQEFFF